MSQEEINKLIDEIDIKGSGFKGVDFFPAEFEKDDDSNHHIAFINAAANLRAINYRIAQSDHQKTKLIAGKIIPAIATTTAMIVGAVAAELIKVVQGFDTIEDYRNSFVNLAINMYVFTEPMPASKNGDVEFDPVMCGPIRSIPKDWTIWDLIQVDGSKTV